MFSLCLCLDHDWWLWMYTAKGELLSLLITLNEIEKLSKYDKYFSNGFGKIIYYFIYLYQQCFFLAIFRWNWTFQYSFGIVILVWYTSIHLYTYIYFFSIPNCNNLILLLRYLFNYWFSLHSSPSPNSIFVAWNWNRWYVCDCSMFIKCWRLWSNI